MKKNGLTMTALILCLNALALAQSNVPSNLLSKDEKRPTPLNSATLKTTLVDDAAQGHQTYHFSMPLKPGANKAVLKVKMEQCGGSVSVYVNTFANVFPNDCDTATSTATGALDFTARGTKPSLVTIYVSGSDNERFEIDLSFIGSDSDLNKPVPPAPTRSKKKKKGQ